MNFQEKINQDLKEAMKAKDEKALRGIRAIKAAILLANTDGSGQELTEERSIAILQKLVKQRRESLDIYTKQQREDLAAIERDEITIIERYLPAQLDEAELRRIIQEIITATGAVDAKDMGKVMKVVMPKVAGRAPNDAISAAVKELLTQ